jgi:tRNA A37 methylthiotransferase MiaB
LPSLLSCAGTVLQVIAENHNVCNQLHMPAQSGASSTLSRMRRGYTREAYDALVQHARNVIPGVALSTDIITGKCGTKMAHWLRHSTL